MNSSRKDFLKAASAFLAVGTSGLKAAQAAGLAKGEPKLVFGAISDVHISSLRDGKSGYAGDTVHLEKAFTYFRDHGADGVVIAGDMANDGLLDQLVLVGNTWKKVFPGNRGLGGKHVEKLFVYGNHDRWMGARRGRPTVGPNYAESWRTAFDEDYDEILIKEVKGYRFVLNHLLEYPADGAYAEFIANHRRFLTGSKPFFYVQHYHPRGTCSAPWTWGQDNGVVTKILSSFPNAVAFSGHSHTPLCDDRTVWQGAFTSIGTASLRYLIPFGGRENSVVFGARRDLLPDQQMRQIDCSDGKNGLLVSVYDDCLVLARRDFQYDLPVGADWVIPWPRDNSFAFAPRAARASVPEFPVGAAVTITKGRGKTRKGVPMPQTTVTFPNVRGPVRAFDYEVVVECEDVDTTKILATKRVYSDGYYRAPEKDVKQVSCVFGDNELTAPAYKSWDSMRKVVPLTTQAAARWRFVVRPCNCFGGKGKAIYSDWQA